MGLLDTSASQMGFSDLAVADSTFVGWPRSDSRRAATERALDGGYADAEATLRLFAQTPPSTVQGAIALAGAYEQSGRRDEARA